LPCPRPVGSGREFTGGRLSTERRFDSLTPPGTPDRLPPIRCSRSRMPATAVRDESPRRTLHAGNAGGVSGATIGTQEGSSPTRE
jgi:hypothetical protein